MTSLSVPTKIGERAGVCVQLIGARRETAGWNQKPISGEWNKQTSRVHGETNKHGLSNNGQSTIIISRVISSLTVTRRTVLSTSWSPCPLISHFCHFKFRHNMDLDNMEKKSSSPHVPVVCDDRSSDELSNIDFHIF